MILIVRSLIIIFLQSLFEIIVKWKGRTQQRIKSYCKALVSASGFLELKQDYLKRSYHLRPIWIEHILDLLKEVKET